MKKNALHLHDLIGILNRMYPPDLAEDWDNVGLQVGDPGAAVERIMVALDPSLKNLRAAIKQNCQLLLTHHPLIFKPLKQISTNNTHGLIIAEALRHNVAIVCAHTNLDSAPDGLNDWLAEALHLQHPDVLQPSEQERFFKLVVYVPHEHKNALLQALFKGGAGQIGNYDRCAFSVEGQGQFRPGAGTNPYLGTIGREELVEEARVETIVPGRNLSRVLKHMHKAHPYEEVAYDLFALHNRNSSAGLGRIGRLDAYIGLHAFAQHVKETLGCSGLRIVGDAAANINKVAVCSGSGSAALYAAKYSGADVLVTGDMKYHEAQTAQDLGINVIDAGHFATEAIVAAGLQAKLGPTLQDKGYGTEIIVAPDEQDPFTYI